jgi:Leucine-rich repeat (LRR) protein
VGLIIVDLASLKNLEELDLSFSTVDNSFLQIVGKITTLNSLRLNGCQLKGSIPKAQGKSDHLFLP